MNSLPWFETFRNLYDKALSEYRSGNRNADAFFSQSEATFLLSIGCRPVELLDFAEDSSKICWEAALLITAARRDHFLLVQNGVPSKYRMALGDFSPKDAKLDGIPWLPRIIQKAKGKLRGELPDDLMFCCGGDRKFLAKYNVEAAEFLRLVWLAGNDEWMIVRYLRSR